jgi:hypothetical protein
MCCVRLLCASEYVEMLPTERKPQNLRKNPMMEFYLALYLDLTLTWSKARTIVIIKNDAAPAGASDARHFDR